jgi:hypothetical protein
MQLHVIERADFVEYLDFQFEATGKPADDDSRSETVRRLRRR